MAVISISLISWQLFENTSIEQRVKWGGNKTTLSLQNKWTKELSKAKQRVYRTCIRTLHQQSWDSCYFFHFPTHCISPLRHTCSVTCLTLLYFQSWTIRPVSKTRKNSQCYLKTLILCLQHYMSIQHCPLQVWPHSLLIPSEWLRILQLTKMANRIRFHGKRLLKWVKRTGLHSSVHSTTFVYSGSVYDGFNF